MATSLSKQLQRLQAPQTQALASNKKGVSILFDAKEAENTSFDTAFELGLEGLYALIQLDSKFAEFESLLFAEGSKSLQRAVQSTEINKRLDDNVRRFLLLLSPHFLLKPALMALEWLIRRYQIGEYCPEELLMAALPYYGSRTFVLIVRAVPSVKDPSSPWHWLRLVVETGAPLDTHTVHLTFAASPALLRRLGDYAVSAYKMYPRGEAGKLQTLFSFCCAVLLGVLSREDGRSQAHLTCMLPLLRCGLTAAAAPCLTAGCLAVVAHLVTRMTLTPRAMQDFITQLLAVKVASLHTEAISVLLLMFTAQPRLGSDSVTLPDSVKARLGSLTWVPPTLGKLAASTKEGVEVLPLLLPLLSAGLEESKDQSTESGRTAAALVTRLLELVPLLPAQATRVITLVFDNLPGKNESYELVTWYKTTCQLLETKYAKAYDAETRKILSSEQKMKKKLKSLQTVTLGGEEEQLATPRSLASSLLHPEEAVRAAAVTCLGDSFLSLPEEDREWVSECLRERLQDDSPQVVLAVLATPCLPQLLGDSTEATTEAMLELLDSRPLSEWNPALAKSVVQLICASVNVDDEAKMLCLLMGILPHLMTDPMLVSTVAATEFGSQCELILLLSARLEENTELPPRLVAMQGVMEALQSSPEAAMELAEWRLQRPQGVSALELAMHCRLLTRAVPALRTPDKVLHCYKLVKTIVESARKTQRARSEADRFPLALTHSVKLMKETYRAMVTQQELPLEVLLDLLRAVASHPITHKKAAASSASSVLRWCDISQAGSGDGGPEAVEAAVMMTNLLLRFACDDKFHQFRLVLRTYLQTNFGSVSGQLHGLSLCWANPESGPEEKVRALRFGAALLEHQASEAASLLALHPEATLVPSLFGALLHSRQEVRKAAMGLIHQLAMQSDDLMKASSSTPTFSNLVTNLAAREEEIVADEDQLSIVLFSLLSPDPAVQSLLRRSHQAALRSCGDCLIAHCVSPSTPSHVTAAILTAIDHVRSEEVLMSLEPLATRLLTTSWLVQEMEPTSWQILRLVLGRVDEISVPSLCDGKGWALLQTALESPLRCGQHSVSATTLGLITKEVFAGLTTSCGRLLTVVLALPGSVKHEVASLLRRVALSASLVEEQLRELMVPVQQLQPRRRKSETAAADSQTSVTAETWERGVVLLEALQEKKKLAQASALIPVLQEVLRKCVDGDGLCDEEYVKQLAVGALSTCLSLAEPSSSHARSQLDVELLVQCLRGTSNPHTQHQTLLLLAQSAHLLPDGLLHHLVTVFTFMGTLVMRHDDAFSFHVIEEVIDKVVPVILKAQGEGESSTIGVLRVFVDAMPDVPSHRRVLVFSRLMGVLGWSQLWLFLALSVEGVEGRRGSPRLACALELAATCPLPTTLAACTKTLLYLAVLATIKYSDQKHVLEAAAVRLRLQQCGASQLQDPCTKPAAETRRLQLVGLQLLTDLLAKKPSPQAGREGELEGLYRELMEVLMSYLTLLGQEERTAGGASKFLQAMLHHAYGLLNKVNLLLPTRQFLAVVRGVLEGGASETEGVRAKALEVLGARLQLRPPASLDPEERAELLALAPGLTRVTLAGGAPADKALFCLRILAKQMAPDNPRAFGPVMVSLIQLVESGTTAPATQAGALLCLAELCASLRAAAVPSLPRLVPLVLAAASKHREPRPDASELVLVGAAAALQRLVETLPHFLSPFLSGVLRELSMLNCAAPKHVSVKAAAALQPRLDAIKSGMSHVALRVLLPALSSVACELRAESADTLPALGPLMDVLATSLASLERTQIEAHLSELTAFFLSALELRADWEGRQGERVRVQSLAEWVWGDSYLQSQEELAAVSGAEDHVVAALVALVLKLPESLFRPLYYQLSNWSAQAEQDSALHARCTTFYRCSTALARSLKGLFVVFAFYFLKQAASLLQRCQEGSKEGQEAPLFGPEEGRQRGELLDSVLETLLVVCTHDKQNFVNKECFDALMQPLVDQLENHLGGDDALRSRCFRLVDPCLAQFAKATADDLLWKELNYQVLLKTRHTNPTVRLVSVRAVQSVAEALGEELLPLLPEMVPFLAELLEDEDAEVEAACQATVRQIEKVLGEPLNKYF